MFLAKLLGRCGLLASSARLPPHPPSSAPRRLHGRRRATASVCGVAPRTECGTMVEWNVEPPVRSMNMNSALDSALPHRPPNRRGQSRAQSRARFHVRGELLRARGGRGLIEARVVLEDWRASALSHGIFTPRLRTSLSSKAGALSCRR